MDTCGFGLASGSDSGASGPFDGATGARIRPIGGGALTGSSRSVRLTSNALDRARLGVDGLTGGLPDLNAGKDFAGELLVVSGEGRP